MLVPKLRPLKMIGSAVLLFLVAAFARTVAIQNDALDVEAPLNAKHSQSSILNRIRRYDRGNLGDLCSSCWGSASCSYTLCLESYANPDGSEEYSPLGINCDGNFEFMCDGRCRSLSIKCDGYRDCNDGDDEVDCPTPATEATRADWSSSYSSGVSYYTDRRAYRPVSTTTTEAPEVTTFGADAETASGLLAALESINTKLNSTLELSSQIDALSTKIAALSEQVTQLLASNNETIERHRMLLTTVRLIQKDNMARATASVTCERRLKALESKCGQRYGR